MSKFLGVLLGIACICMPASVSAAAPTPNVGVTVRPAIANITVQPGQTNATFTTTLENDTDQQVTIVPTASDFSTVGVNGAIELKPPDTLHGLAANLQFEPATFVLAKGQSRTVTVQVRDVSGLSPGGHFAAIRYHIATGAKANGTSSIGANSELLSFVFLATAGQAQYGVSLRTSLPHFALWQPPTEADLLFTNTANTQTAPRGIVNISGPGHSQVANSIINPDSSLVLPGSTRLFQTQLHRIKTAILPGMYTVDVYYRATTTAGYEHVQQRFFLVGWPVLAFAVGVIVSLVVAMRFVRKRRNAPPKTTMLPAAETAGAPKRRSIPVKHL